MKKYLQFTLLTLLMFACETKGEFTPELAFYSDTITADTMTLEQSGGDYIVSISSNIEWSIFTNNDWIELSATEGVATEKQDITLSISPNQTYENRLGEVVVKYGDKSQIIYVEQLQKDTLSTNKDIYEIDYTEQTLQITVSSNIDVEIDIPADADWITVAPESKAMSDKIINLNIAKNGYDERSAIVTIKNSGSGISETIEIIQAQEDAIVIGNAEFELDYTEQQLEITVASNVDLEVVIPTDVDWIAVAPESRALSNNVITLDITANDNKARTTTIIIRDINSEIEINVVIEQDGVLRLSDFANSYMPSGSEWIIIDDDATLVDFLDLRTLLQNNDYLYITIKFPNLKSLPNKAFQDCNSLRSISCPSATNVGSEAFYCCRYLHTADFPSATFLGERSFSICQALWNLNFPNVETVSNAAFQNCKSIQSLDFPEAIIIGDYAFSLGNISYTDYRTTSNVDHINFPKATHIGDDAFKNYDILTELSFPAVTHIGDGSFGGCKNVGTLNFPKVVSIGGAAFISCGSIVDIDFPDLIELGGGAFGWCKALKSVSLPKIDIIEGQSFRNCDALVDVYIPNAESVEFMAFTECLRLKSIELPLVKSLGKESFYGCVSLESIKLPAATSVDNLAFAGSCVSLSNIELATNDGVTMDSFGSDVFKIDDSTTRNEYVTLIIGNANQHLINNNTITVNEKIYGNATGNMISYTFKEIILK